MRPFINKICQEYLAGNVIEAIVLTHNCSDTKWYRKLVNTSICFCVVKGRIRFEKADGTPVNGSPIMGSVFFYLGKDYTKFVEAFRDVGNIMWSVA